MILAPTPAYMVNGEKSRTVCLYDGTVGYFSEEHLPYALSALGVLMLISFPPPLLLGFYQTSWFQKCLNCCQKKKQIIISFTNAFQGCFKNGTDGTHDCRFFAGIYFLLRIVIFSLYAFITNYYVLYFIFQMVLIVTCGLFIIFRPYKCDLFNLLDPLLLLLYINITSAAVQNMIATTLPKDPLANTIYLYVSLFIPMLYVFVYLGVWFVKRMRNLWRYRQPPQQLPQLNRRVMSHSDDQPSSIPFSPREVVIDDEDQFDQPYIMQGVIEPCVRHEEDTFEESVRESLEYISEGDTTPLTRTLSSPESSADWS